MKPRLFLPVLAIMLGMVAVAQADPITLYSDAFTNSTGSNVLLSNHPLDVTSGLYGATAGAGWTASSGWSDNYISGRAYTTNGNPAHSDAWLPLTPQSGCVYTLSAKLYMYQGNDSSAATSQYFGLGFAYATSGVPSTSAAFYTPAQTWIVDNPMASSYKIGYASTSASSFTDSKITYNSSLSLVDGWHTLKVVLDTSNAQWVASYFVDTTSLGSVTYAAGSNPVIKAVGFGGYVGNGSSPMLDTFSLTATPSQVPEPGTLALLAAGLVGLVAYAWRKRG
ncbi:MAG: PEP-CTERM sorting domain-containing protein [Thermoguttaceae bacterium]